MSFPDMPQELRQEGCETHGLSIGDKLPTQFEKERLRPASQEFKLLFRVALWYDELIMAWLAVVL